MKFKATKLIPIVLAVAMCGSMAAGCTKKNDDPPHTHAYSYTDKDDANHTKTCTGCDDVNETEAHVYDNAQDTTCNLCGHVRTITPADPSGDTGDTFDGKIYVVGDSTVCSFNDNYYIPRYGYGTQLAEYLNVTSDQIVNLALSGRSSKSFLTEANYTTLTTSIADGDYLIIGFGHNDEKSDEDARYTDANGTKDAETTTNGTSFAYTLYQNYIKMATDKGATPILCTPIVRYDANGNYTGAKIHNTTDSDKNGKGGDYVKAIKDLGEATDTVVVDLTTLTKTVYEADNAEAAYFHAYTTYEGDLPDATPAGRDDTHINKYGAKMVAYQFANAIKSSDSDLKQYVKSGITAPTKAADYPDAINAAFVKPDYTPFDPSSYEANELGGGWYKTVMGDAGGADKIPTYTVTKDASNKFTVGNAVANGKFASGSDGFAAAFMQINKADNLNITATVKVIECEKANNQSGFGIMLRDDILVDTHDNTEKSNYTAAGILHTKATIFSRENGTLKNGEAASTVAAGSEFNLQLTRTGQTVVCKVGNVEKTFTDFDFFARDNDYMYLCLFANRGFVVEFTNVVVTIDAGAAQGA